MNASNIICSCVHMWMCHIQNKLLHFLIMMLWYLYICCVEIVSAFFTIKLFFPVGRQDKNIKINTLFFGNMSWFCSQVYNQHDSSWIRVWKAKYLFQQNFHDLNILLSPYARLQLKASKKKIYWQCLRCYLIECDTFCGFLLLPPLRL